MMSTSKVLVNLDWTRDPPPAILTPYQQLIRSIDWSKTAFGSMESWPRDVRQFVRFMMADPSPGILYLGDDHTIMYNEAHVPFTGKNHPRMLGSLARNIFPEFWDYFANIMAEQRITGQGRTGEVELLLIERHGFVEETYFSWQLTPVIGDDGSMIGGYGIPTESSKEIISSRRAACVQNLAKLVSGVSSFDQFWQAATTGLSENDKDVPIAMLYSLDRTASSSEFLPSLSLECTLRSTVGVCEGHQCAKACVDLQQDQSGLAPFMLQAYRKESVYAVQLAEAGLEHIFDNIVWRGFGIPIKEVAFLPIRSDEAVIAILVLGLNPRLKFTNSYQNFVQSIADVMSPQIARLMLAERAESQEQRARRAVTEFQRSEMKFSRFAQRSPLGLSLTDVNGKIMYANEAWYNFCGLDPGNIEFSHWVDTVYEDDLPLINDWWHRVIDLKQSGTFQIRSRKPFVSGDMKLPYRTAIVAIYPDLDENGDVATVMGLVTDISELKWTEEQLLFRQREIEESEKKYRDFAEHAPIGVIRTDVMGNVQFANNAWRSFYDFDDNYVFTEPQPWLKALNRDDAPLASQFFDDICLLRAPKSVEVRLRKRKSSAESGRSTPGEFWLLATGFAETNADGSIDSIVFWVTDISDQKAAERVLTSKMEEAIRLKDTQERFVDMISHEIRNPLSAILHCGEEIVEAMKSSLISTDVMPAPSEIIKQHSIPSLRKNVSSALDAANTILYCVQHQKQIVDDVLTLSKLDADLLVVSPIPIQPTELLTSALKIFEPEVKAASIQLDFEIGPSLEEIDVNWIMLDPNRFLQIVINLVTNAIKFTRNVETRKIVISVSARRAKPPREHHGVHYVPRRESVSNGIGDVLYNGIDEPSQEDLYLCFSVSDTGKGLTESERTTLFKRFTQASPKTHIEYGGSGLGLFISRQITEMLGGEIGVGSEPGKGATFAFYVRTQRAKPPRRPSLSVESLSMYSRTRSTPDPDTWVGGHTEHPESKVDKKLVEKSIISTHEPTIRKRRVLVVEDNLINQKVLCKQLRNRGFQVDAANHGREALDVLEKVKRDDEAARFDVVLCDIEMPIMDGIQCVAEIRRLENEGEFSGHMPIIGVTANVRSKQVNSAIEVGMDGVTTKPYRIDELIAHIDRVSPQVNSLAEVPG